jgi:hypothetical protein
VYRSWGTPSCRQANPNLPGFPGLRSPQGGPGNRVPAFADATVMRRRLCWKTIHEPRPTEAQFCPEGLSDSGTQDHSLPSHNPLGNIFPAVRIQLITCPSHQLPHPQKQPTTTTTTTKRSPQSCTPTLKESACPTPHMREGETSKDSRELPSHLTI